VCLFDICLVVSCKQDTGVDARVWGITFSPSSIPLLIYRENIQIFRTACFYTLYSGVTPHSWYTPRKTVVISCLPIGHVCLWREYLLTGNSALRCSKRSADNRLCFAPDPCRWPTYLTWNFAYLLFDSKLNNILANVCCKVYKLLLFLTGAGLRTYCLSNSN
jgi:hypothetical protein